VARHLLLYLLYNALHIAPSNVEPYRDAALGILSLYLVRALA
jgi:hypothetical protein